MFYVCAVIHPSSAKTDIQDFVLKPRSNNTYHPLPVYFHYCIVLRCVRLCCILISTSRIRWYCTIQVLQLQQSELFDHNFYHRELSTRCYLPAYASLTNPRFVSVLTPSLKMDTSSVPCRYLRWLDSRESISFRSISLGEFVHLRKR